MNDLMKQIKIEINMPVKSFNLNQLTNSNRGNKYAAASKKKKAMRDIYFLIKPQIKEPLMGKYKVSATWRVTSKNRDLDNLLLKNIFDSMQENNLLKNDNLNHIIEINHNFEIVDKKNEGVTVIFTSVEK